MRKFTLSVMSAALFLAIGPVEAQLAGMEMTAEEEQNVLSMFDEGTDQDFGKLHKQMSEPEEVIEFWNRVTRDYVLNDATDGSISREDIVASARESEDGGLTRLFENDGFVDTDPVMTTMFWQIKGECKGELNKISFTTRNESNVDQHVIERSSDGYSAFMEIGSLMASNVGDEKSAYEFVDDNPQSYGYYRVKSVGNNGDQIFSDIVYLEKPSENPIQYVSSTFDISSAEMFVEYLSNDLKPIEISIYDKIGKKVKSSVIMDHPMSANKHKINLEDLKAGEYQITMKQGDHSVVKKMVKEDQKNPVRLY